MANKLKGVILSVEDTLVVDGPRQQNVFEEVTKLIKYLQSKGIEFVVFTNRKWTATAGNTVGPLEEKLKEAWGDFPYLCSETDREIPRKPSAKATEYVLNKMGWQANETIYIGASDSDMRTAVNGNLLFLRATWYANKTEYGLQFSTPRDVGRFIAAFCLRDHLWCHEIQDSGLEFYALAPFSTMKQQYTSYSIDARAAAKHGQGHPDFWVGALISSLYFSGIYLRVNYISVYPGHKAGSGNDIMNGPMALFGHCFRKAFLPDLIERHTTAMKSQTARQAGIKLDHLNQLNTIRLNPHPHRNANSTYKKSPLEAGKTILILDDICTNGYSLDTARTYIEQTGAKVIMAAWLKTINSQFEVLTPHQKFDPYKANTFQAAPLSKTFSYNSQIVNSLAPGELMDSFNGYLSWDWPT